MRGKGFGKSVLAKWLGIGKKGEPKENKTIVEEREAMVKKAVKFEENSKLSKYGYDKFVNAIRDGAPDRSYTNKNELVKEASRIVHKFVTDRVGKGGLIIDEDNMKIVKSRQDIKDPNLTLIDKGLFTFAVNFVLPTGKQKKLFAAVDYNFSKTEPHEVVDFMLDEKGNEVGSNAEDIEEFLTSKAPKKEACLVYYNTASFKPHYEALEVKDVSKAKAILETNGFEVKAGYYGPETGINGPAYEVHALPEDYKKLHKVLAQEFPKKDWPERSEEKAKLPYGKKDWPERSEEKQPLADKDLLQSVEKKDWAERSEEKSKPVSDEGMLKYERKNAQVVPFIVERAGRRLVLEKSDVAGVYKIASDIDEMKTGESVDTLAAKELISKVDPAKVVDFESWSKAGSEGFPATENEALPIGEAPSEAMPVGEASSEAPGEGLPAVAEKKEGQKFVGKDAPEETGDKMSGYPDQKKVDAPDHDGTKWEKKPNVVKTEKGTAEQTPYQKKKAKKVDGKRFENDDKPNMVKSEKEEAEQTAYQKKRALKLLAQLESGESLTEEDQEILLRYLKDKEETLEVKKEAQKYVGKDAPEQTGDKMSGYPDQKKVDVPDHKGTKWEETPKLPKPTDKDKSGMGGYSKGEVKLKDIHTAGNQTRPKFSHRVAIKAFEEAKDEIMLSWDGGDISTDEATLRIAQLKNQFKELGWPDRSLEKQPWKGKSPDWPERSSDKGAPVPVQTKDWAERSEEKYKGKPKEHKMMRDESKKEAQSRPPKSWFNKMHKEVKAGNPDYDEDQINSTIGDIWHDELTDYKRKQVEARYGQLELPPLPPEMIDVPEGIEKPELKPEEKGMDLTDKKPMPPKEKKLEPPKEGKPEDKPEEKFEEKKPEEKKEEVLEKLKDVVEEISKEEKVPPKDVAEDVADVVKDIADDKKIDQEILEGKPIEEKKPEEKKEAPEEKKPEEKKPDEKPEEKKDEKGDEKSKKDIPEGLKKFIEEKKEGKPEEKVESKKEIPEGLKKYLEKNKKKKDDKEDKGDKKEALVEKEAPTDTYKPSKGGLQGDKLQHEPVDNKAGKSDEDATDRPDDRSSLHDEIYKHGKEYDYSPKPLEQFEKKFQQKKMAVEAKPELNLDDEKMKQNTEKSLDRTQNIGQGETDLDVHGGPESLTKEQYEDHKHSLYSASYIAERIVRSVSNRENNTVQDGLDGYLKSEMGKNIGNKQEKEIKDILIGWGFNLD